MSEVQRIRDYFSKARWHSTAAREELIRERFDLLLQSAVTGGPSLENLVICDVGCGGGADLAAWRDSGVPEGNLTGTELMPDRAAIARDRLPGADVQVVEGFELPFESDTFNLCTASLVLSTVLSETGRARLLAEMERVTTPGGMIAVYDFAVSKPWNRNVRAVTTSELKRRFRPPDSVHRAAPFLPALEVAVMLPRGVGVPLIAVLPRTHRLWVWRISTTGRPLSH